MTSVDGMRVGAVWRYPVKSLLGETLSEAVLEESGLQGDRCWGIRDDATGKILTGRRDPQLLLARSSVGGDGAPDITLPSGEVCHGTGRDTNAALSDWLGRPVTLVASTGAPGGEAEAFADATDDGSDVVGWTMPPGRFVDAMPLLVVTDASLRAGAELHPDGEWDVRRFRPNLLLEVDQEGWVEDGWCGRALRVGDAVIRPFQACSRCSMVTRPQPDLSRDVDIYKTLSRHHGGTFGVWTHVDVPATVSVGDSVSLE